MFRTFALAGADAPDLTNLIQQVKEKNPRIQEAYRAWKVTERQVSPAGTWPNPRLNVSREKEAGMDPMRLKKIGVSQEIPFPGKLTSEERMKYHEALIAGSHYQDTTLDVVSELRLRIYQLLLTDQLIALADQNADTMRQALRSSESRLASGSASTSDVFMAQVELRKMENMLFEQKQQRRLIESELNALLDEPVEKSWGTPLTPPLQAVPISLSDLQTVAEQMSPLVLSAQHEKHHGQSMVRRSRLDFAPDVEVMALRQTADQAGTGHEIGLSLSIPLWFKRPWNNFAGAKEHFLETEAGTKAMITMVKKMVRMEYIEAETHKTLAEQYQTGILPPTAANLKLTQASYSAGKTDFLRLQDAVRTWTETNIRYQNELYHAAEHWSLLERWAGVDLFEAKAMIETNTMKKENHHEK